MTSTTRDADYAFWTEPSTGFTAAYSLGVFHEIDFEVNEGYRRIPHGGIEIGGLLFGRSEANGVRIEAFRLIECEHASGPSFVLSERDVVALREQILQSARDPELSGLEVLGWFIAHTRASLEMNDREVALFDEFFSQPGKITLLVKPERFQPTRFGFLVRDSYGKMPRNATDHAVILPLPGRAGRAERSTPGAVPPPKQTASPPTAAPADRVSHAPPVKPAPPPTPPIPTPDPAPQPSRLEAAAQPKRIVPDPGTNLVPYSPPLPSIDEIRRRRSAYLGGYAEPLQLPGEVQRTSLGANLRLTLVLFLAAAIGCGVGYWAYLQLPSTTIPLYVQAQSSALVVSWPPDQTRDCVFAALRIDDRQEMPLSLMQRAAGQASVTPTTDNLKIELIAQHWLRDSRGIIRYVKAQSPPAPAQPIQVVKPATPSPPSQEER